MDFKLLKEVALVLTTLFKLMDFVSTAKSLFVLNAIPILISVSNALIMLNTLMKMPKFVGANVMPNITEMIWFASNVLLDVRPVKLEMHVKLVFKMMIPGLNQSIIANANKVSSRMGDLCVHNVIQNASLVKELLPIVRPVTLMVTS